MKPIETAPKDLAVLVFCPKNKQLDSIINIAVFKTGLLDGYWSILESEEQAQPTHWMSLPDGPVPE